MSVEVTVGVCPLDLTVMIPFWPWLVPARPGAVLSVAYRWIPEPYEGARYTVRKLRFRRMQIFNNLICDILTQIRSFARDASQQACHVTVRLQVGGGALYSHDTLWKAYLTLVQQRLIDRA